MSTSRARRPLTSENGATTSSAVDEKRAADPLRSSAGFGRQPQASTASSWLAPSVQAPKLAKGKSGRAPGPLDFLGGGLDLTGAEVRLLAGIIALAVVVRLWKIERPDSVVFDEVHFGGFATKYIKSRFFMDVHPPLAKLLITAAGAVAGFRGNFDFKDIGKEYKPDGVPYVSMRMLPAVLGIAVVPLAYLTLRGLKCRSTTALLGSLLVTFDNALITQSRLILLDSPLLFFTALTLFFWVGFSNEDQLRAFTPRWWTWLVLCGTSLGAVVSSKWVGLFTIATIGVATIRQLWDLLGDLRIPIPTLFRHFVARAIGLIAVPALFYLAMFGIHFAILRDSGDGDGFMSSEFQHTLNGHGMADTYADVYLGSKITIKHLNTQGGYLHSHPHMYQTGSKQQQITLYPHRDDNNDWIVLNVTHEAEHNPWVDTPMIALEDGMQVRFSHNATDRKLHSHDLRPPVSDVDWQQEVSAYGFEGFEGDANDNFVVEIEKKHTGNKDSKAKSHVRALRTKFRLRHALTGCYLFSHKVKLPEWAFEQQEVTCNKNPSMANSLWYIETNLPPHISADAEKVNYRNPGFLAKFAELQKVMWTTNAGLTDRHAYDSRPGSWPVLARGINFWVKDHTQIYLIGNPVIWYLSTLAVVAYVGVRALLFLRWKRGYKDFHNTTVVFYDRLCGFLTVGWALHYLPFFLMSRQLFLHHYLPALYFAILLLSAVFDVVTNALKPRYRLSVAVVIALLAISAFFTYSPLIYAGQWTKAQCESHKLLKTWDFSCGDFPDQVADYPSLLAAARNASISAAEAALNDPTVGENVGIEGEEKTTTTAVAVEAAPNAFHPDRVAKARGTSAGEMPPVDPYADANGEVGDVVDGGDEAAAAPSPVDEDAEEGERAHPIPKDNAATAEGAE